MSTILDLPVHTAARLVALSHLRAAAGALGGGEEVGLREPEVRRLHGALRRLRTVVRAYRPYLEESLRRGDLRRLRELLRAGPGDRAREVRVSRLVRRMERRLARYTVRVTADALRPPVYAAVLGDLVRRSAGRLCWRLEAVHAAEDPAAIRRARLEAERLRHLLEPVREDSPEAADLLARLEALQRDPRAGPHADGLRAGVDAVLGFLKVWGEAGVEVERKYLLRALPELPGDPPALEIAQGWLPGTRLLERLRHVRSADGERWFRTVKLGYGVRRIEVEEETDPGLFASLWPLTEGRRVVKRRYRVAEGGHLWEIDHFPERDLVLAEVELASDALEPPLPAWLVPLLVREVTGEAEYVNVNLAR